MAVICDFFLSLTGEVHTFEALDSDPMLVKLIDAQCPVGSKIALKVGAQVSVCTYACLGKSGRSRGVRKLNSR